jgi:RNA polymerase sigma-54 factor
MSQQSARLSVTQKLQLNGSLSTSIRVLRLDAAGLTQYLEEEAAENPHLALAPPPMDPMHWLPRWTTAFAAQGMGTPGRHDLNDFLPAPAVGLIAHITREIGQLSLTAPEQAIAYDLMQALDPSGWLGRPLADIAADAGYDTAHAARVLTRLQTLEPTGIFAQSLAECLQLQAKENGDYDTVMACMLEHLDMLANGQIAQLAAMCAVPEPAILARLRTIRSFNPKPGTEFGQNAAPVREPDLMVARGATGWLVSLNRSALPDVQVNADCDSPTPNALTSARDLQRMVASRNHTLLRIAQDILKRQEQVLSGGLECLQPMSMQQIADALDLHVSTISRALSGVSIDAPRGTIWLRSLFTAAVSEGGPAAGALRAQLMRLVHSEDPANPLSDQALSDALSTPQASVARRTVAKYRVLLGIPPAHRRKRRP